MDKLKKKYNELLQREKKAEEYFERKDLSWEEKSKQIPNFKKILDGLEAIRIKLEKDHGYKMSSEEMLNGFKE